MKPSISLVGPLILIILGSAITGLGIYTKTLSMFIPSYGGNIYRFNFYVYDAETRKPIEGAEVRIYSNVPGGYVTGLTDDRGYCWLGSNVEYGFERIEALKAGYEKYVDSAMPKEVDYGDNYIYLQKAVAPISEQPAESLTFLERIEQFTVFHKMEILGSSMVFAGVLWLLVARR